MLLLLAVGELGEYCDAATLLARYGSMLEDVVGLEVHKHLTELQKRGRR